MCFISVGYFNEDKTRKKNFYKYIIKVQDLHLHMSCLVNFFGKLHVVLAMYRIIFGNMIMSYYNKIIVKVLVVRTVSVLITFLKKLLGLRFSKYLRICILIWLIGHNHFINVLWTFEFKIESLEILKKRRIFSVMLD